MPEQNNQSNPVAVFSGARILLLEKDAALVEIFRHLLRSLECRVKVCSALDEISDLLDAENLWNACFCDIAFLNSGCADSQQLLTWCENSGIPVVVLAGYAQLQQADLLVANGCFAKLAKPLRSEQVLKTLEKALTVKTNAAQKDIPYTDASAEEMYASSRISLHLGSMVGESPVMHELYSQIQRIAPTDLGVLIQGGSGTGKELVARAIHHESLRCDGPFVAVNCASLPQNLLESELFGHVKGAFTGAVRDKNGLYLAANNGTLFLDEIGSIAEPTQLALLRALQESEIRPVGSTSVIHVNVRVVAATNENINKLLETGKLRKDLYYRICAFPLHVPALHDRRGDVELLCRHFLNALGDENGRCYRLSSEAEQVLANYEWPGNIRELRHVMQRMVAFAPSNGLITLEQIPDNIRSVAGKISDLTGDDEQPTTVTEAGRKQKILPKLTLKAYLRQCERQYIMDVLTAYDGDKEAAARTLGISVSTLYRKQEL